MKFLKESALFIILSCLLSLQTFASVPTKVVPGGNAIGLSLSTDGVYVTDFNASPVSPAQEAGIHIGDRITKINGKQIASADELPALVNSENGKPVKLTVERDRRQLEITVQPVQAAENWKLGLFVKDHIAGIGTLTYYDPENGRFGALGHAVGDGTSEAAAVRSGDLLDVEIVTVQRGERGSPGALVGTYFDATPIGSIDSNIAQGVFGTLTQAPEETELYPIASPDEICCGSATILCTLSDSSVQEYKVEITSFRADDPNGRNLKLKVTDPALLEQTGGIVQGISGAPILQQGKLIGAVTHVLVDRPEQGYGIYIGNMLQADSSARQKEAA